MVCGKNGKCQGAIFTMIHQLAPFMNYYELNTSQNRRRAALRQSVTSSIKTMFQVEPTGQDQPWSVEFKADQLQEGIRFCSLTMVDVYTREAVAIEVGQSLKGDDVL
jgi:transposase InsO family protein